MTLSARDRKLLVVIVPVAMISAFWLLLLSPKREEAVAVRDQLSIQERRRDEANARLRDLTAAQAQFADDYAEVVRLGKAVPERSDVASLLVQLDRAGRRTRTGFEKIVVGARKTAAPAPATASGDAGGGAAAASQAQSGPGKAAGGAAAGSAQGGQNNDAPAQGGSADGAAASGGAAISSVPGLDTVPVEFNFSGGYFQLADFFHRLKRFVNVADDRILVRGRLLTIDAFAFGDAGSGARKTAVIKATIYLTPTGQTVGANAAAASGAPASGGGSPSPAASPPPSASVVR